MLRLFLIVNAAIVASASVLPSRRSHIAPFSPVGECPGHQEGIPSFLPDSDNCQLYYECSNGDPIQNHCADGLEWDPIEHVCDWPEHANCQAGKPNKAPKVVHPFSPVGECPEHQGQYAVYLPDSKNCSIFYECSVNGIPLPVPCPPGLEFNPILYVCDFPSAAGCTVGRGPTQVSGKVSKVVHPFSPVGECPGHQEGIPSFLPDSDNCQLYYECSNGVPVQNHCADGLEWDPIEHVCDWPENANCQAEKPKKAPKVVHPFSPVGECPEHQGQYPVYLPDSKNCSIFYECGVNGIPLPLPCPPGLEFDPILHVCNFPSAAGCTAGRSSYSARSIVGQCPEHDGQYPVYLPDDKDCSAFYECSNGVPIKLHCAPGTLFDSVSRRCRMASEATCQS